MKLATVKHGTEEYVVDVGVGTVAGFVAVVAIVPLVVTTVADTLVEPLLTHLVETAELKLERRKVEAELYRTALANPDAAQRKVMMDFLIKARLVDNIGSIEPEQIPHWPPPSGPSP